MNARRAGIWAIGLAGSVGAHGAALAILAIAMQPDPVTEQPLPTSELEVEAYELERSDAREARPEADTANPAEAQSASLDPGAIPQSRAEAVATPSAERLSSAAPPAETLGAGTLPAPQVAATVPEVDNVAQTTPAGATLAEAQIESLAAATAAAPVQAALAQAPVATQAQPAAQTTAALSQVQPSTAVTQAAQPDTAPVPALAPVSTQAPTIVQAAASLAQIRPSTAIAVAARPDTATAPKAELAPAALPQTAPNAVAAAPAQPQATATVAAVAEGTKVKATLAFPGGGDGGVDPVSLAAFQSFMQPGDVQATGDTPRDGVSALFAQVPCSRLQVAFDPETATLNVNGHIPEGDLRAPVLAALQDQMGADIAVSDNILILPRPQCGALSGIGNVGLPQSTDQNTNPLLIGEDTHARVLDFVKDDRLFFDITAPDYAAYVYVDFFDAGGNVLHLAPNDQVPLRRAEPKTALRIGTQSDADTGLQIFIGPPYGQEIAVAFAASEPLYEGLRPIVEPAAPYLEWLKSRVTQARETYPDFKGEWVYFFITTAEN